MVIRSHKVDVRLPEIVEGVIQWQEEHKYLSYVRAFSKLVMLGDRAITDHEKFEQAANKPLGPAATMQETIKEIRFYRLEQTLKPEVNEDTRKQPVRKINVPDNLFDTHRDKKRNMSIAASLVQSAIQGAKIMLTYIGLKEYFRDVANRKIAPNDQHQINLIYVDYLDDVFGVLDGHTADELRDARLQIISDTITGREPGHGKREIDYEAIEDQIIRNLERSPANSSGLQGMPKTHTKTAKLRSRS